MGDLKLNELLLNGKQTKLLLAMLGNLTKKGVVQCEWGIVAAEAGYGSAESARVQWQYLKARSKARLGASVGSSAAAAQKKSNAPVGDKVDKSFGGTGDAEVKDSVGLTIAKEVVKPEPYHETTSPKSKKQRVEPIPSKSKKGRVAPPPPTAKVDIQSVNGIFNKVADVGDGKTKDSVGDSEAQEMSTPEPEHHTEGTPPTTSEMCNDLVEDQPDQRIDAASSRAIGETARLILANGSVKQKHYSIVGDLQGAITNCTTSLEDCESWIQNPQFQPQRWSSQPEPHLEFTALESEPEADQDWDMCVDD